MLTVVVAGLAELARQPLGGDDLNVQFYALVAQIIPILVVAYMVELHALGDLREIRPRLRQDLDRLAEQAADPSESEERRTQAAELQTQLDRLRESGRDMTSGIAGVVGIAITGETAALYAVATHETSTFLLWVCASSLIAFSYLFIGAFFDRFRL